MALVEDGDNVVTANLAAFPQPALSGQRPRTSRDLFERPLFPLTRWRLRWELSPRPSTALLRNPGPLHPRAQ